MQTLERLDAADGPPAVFVPNWIGGAEAPAKTGETFEKLNPSTGAVASTVARSRDADVLRAVEAARRSQPAWAAMTAVRRGEILREAALMVRARVDEFAQIVSQETGKSPRDARAETLGAFEMGMFVAGEGRRLYGRTTTSAVGNRWAMTVRQPLGVAGLIVAANTPIANVAWKAFPALLCGNSAVLKAAEDTPMTAWRFAQVLSEAGVPGGVFNVVQGFGEEAGAPLVESQDVDVVSFTGSTAVGRIIQEVAGKRLAKVCLELGGKNPLVVCDDADLDAAVEAAVLSAFSNAGQRCAAGSRVIVFDAVYDEFVSRLERRTSSLKLGCSDDDDLGPVINGEQLASMLAAIQGATESGARILTGGYRLTDAEHAAGFYLAPTWLEGLSAGDSVTRTELFGPISSLYRVADFQEALRLANDSPYGLTSAIFTNNVSRAMAFAEGVKAGVVAVNGATYGSEPHMPFGGLKQSGNGLREAGTEALDVYSDWKTIYLNFDPSKV